MNYVDLICEMLKIEKNQPFKIKGISDCWYKINDNCETEWDAGTNKLNWYIDRVILMQILSGCLEIEVPRRMTIEEIERELGYPIKIVESGCKCC